MKSESRSRRQADDRGKGSVGLPHLPIEWMDPMSWRLPSGKALAEFALQTGFLAPLMMRAPKIARKNLQLSGRPLMPSRTMSPPIRNSPLTREQVEEAPARSASFRYGR